MRASIRPGNRIRVVIGACALMLCLPLCWSAAAGARQRNFGLDPAIAAKSAAGEEALRRNGPAAAAPLGTFVRFDAPGGVNGTVPAAINQAGEITGYYLDAASVGHGFWRSSHGSFVPIDVKGAVNGTYPISLAANGAITGSWEDADFNSHGFVRSPNGVTQSFDAPGVLQGGLFTTPTAINPAGEVIGYYFDANFVAHGFVRTTDGRVFDFDPPDAGVPTNPAGLVGTRPANIDPEGNIIGVYTDKNGAQHGFLLDMDGHYSTFTPPNETTFGMQVFFGLSSGPNLYRTSQGTMIGTYQEAISGNPFGGNFRVFILPPGGAFTVFDAATYPPCCIWSFPSGVDQQSEIVGSFNDGFNRNHGFLRAADGSVTTFDEPDAANGNFQGTVPGGITPGGTIMGTFIDQNYVRHGFLLVRHP